MKPQSLHSHEDTLLDFAYGELPAAEARAVETHLQDCGRCAEALASIRGVRTTMAHLRQEPAPDAGLESLLAYAEQAARRTQAGPAPRDTWWRRLIVPVSATAALCLVAVVGLQVSKEVDLAGLPEASLQKERAEERRQAPASPLSVAPAPVAAAEVEGAPAEFEDRAAESRADRKAEQAPARARAKDFDAPADWSNAGSGGGLGAGDKMESKKSKSAPAPKKIAGSSFGSTGAVDDASMSDVAERQTAKREVMAEPLAEVGRSAKSESPGAASSREGGAAAANTVGKGSISAPPPAPQAGAQKEDSAPTLALDSRSYGARPRAESSSEAESSTSFADDEDESDGVAEAVTSFSNAAWDAYRRGDRAGESALLQKALAAGAAGNDRAGLLNRLCEAQFALGLTARAEQTCERVVAEFPNSGAASAARRSLARMAPAKAPSEPSKASKPAPSTQQ